MLAGMLHVEGILLGIFYFVESLVAWNYIGCSDLKKIASFSGDFRT